MVYSVYVITSCYTWPSQLPFPIAELLSHSLLLILLLTLSTPTINYIFPSILLTWI